MTTTDSVFKADSGTSPEKKGVVADPKKDVADPQHNDATDHPVEDHSTIAATKLADVHESTWGGSAWNMLKGGYDAITGFVKPDKADQTVADIEDLHFTDDIFKTGNTTKPDATVAAAANKPADSASGISGWFSKMGDAVASVGKEVTGHVTSAMDWLFSSTDKQGNKTEVSANNGEAHIKGKNPDGVPVDVSVGQHKIEGDVGAAKVMLDKDTKEGHYTSGAYDVTVKNGIKTVVDGATHEQFQWDEKAQKGFIADKDGKHLFDFTSKDQLTQRLTSESAITQTNTRADSTGDAVSAQMANGTAERQTRYIVDKEGNYAVVRKDGLMVKTYKSEGFVTIEKDGHMVKIQNNQAFVQEEIDGKKEWVAMRGHQHDLPPGMVVDTNTGAVAIDGKTVVTDKGNVQVDAGTHIDTKTGKMTTQSDTGVVTVDNANGKTHVRHNGCGDIVNDGHSFVNLDPKTQHTFSGWNTDTGVIQAFGGEHGSGISLDTRVGGNLTIREANGQVTQMSNTGYFNSVDAQGNSLMSVDSNGNATFYDGTRVGSDGTVSNQYGSGSAWDDGSNASSAIANASGAVGAALAASSQFDPNGSTLGMLDAADSELSSLAQVYTAMGRLDLVGQLSSTQGQVADARSRISQVIGVSDDSRRLTGDGSSSRVHEALNNGSPENYLLNQMAEKNHTDEKSTAA